MNLETMTTNITPPKAKKITYKTNIHNQELVDDYHWLRDNNWPKVKRKDVLEYLEAENAYAKDTMQQYSTLQEEVYKELEGRIKKNDESYPEKEDNYYYYSKIRENQNYSTLCRRKDSMKNEEEIILDANTLAKGYDAFRLGGVEVSPDHSMIVYGVDTHGEERFTAYVKNLRTVEVLNDEVKNTIGSIIWHENNQGFFYSKLDDDWRHKQVFYHQLGTKQESDKLIFKEERETFSVGISKSASREYLFVHTSSNTNNESWYINLKSDSLAPQLIEKRRDDHLYSVDHKGDYFYISTNDMGKNFRLVRTKIDQPSQAFWQEVISHSEREYFVNYDLYKNHLVVTHRINGLNQIKVISDNNEEEFTLSFADEIFDVETDFTNFEDNFLRISYSSPITPASTLEYDFSTKEIFTRKTQAIPAGYTKNDYLTKRIWAPSTDGVKVPISIVYKKSLFKNDGSNPVYLYGYGSYGIQMDMGFNKNMLSLLDRGFIFAVSHIRGGDDLGYDWYESAKFLNKKRTFQDFAASAQYMIDSGYTKPGNIVISGGSAGGMLVAVAANEIPHLLKGVVARVPFVDVLNTMLDHTLPLTPGEFKEWGNPKDKEYFEYIKSYSPYDNIKAQDYPSMYITAGLTDPRVTYWEPAKWVAKLRDLKTDNNVILFKTEMQSGHGGKSGRYKSLEELSEVYTFVISLFDKKS
jgi:oligopeptidase B